MRSQIGANEMEINRNFRSSEIKSFSVYNDMKRKLLSGQYYFGEKLSVRKLAEEYDVSRRPIMDSLKILENEGFLEIVPQSGCKVVEYVKKDIIDDLLVSSSLESLCAELAAKNHTSKQINKLIEFQKEMKVKLKGNTSMANYFHYNRKFHYQILMMVHSERISLRTMNLWDLNDFYLTNLSLSEDLNLDNDVAIEYHDKIIEALENRNASEAKLLMQQHFQDYIERIENNLP